MPLMMPQECHLAQTLMVRVSSSSATTEKLLAVEASAVVAQETMVMKMVAVIAESMSE